MGRSQRKGSDCSAPFQPSYDGKELLESHLERLWSIDGEDVVMHFGQGKKENACKSSSSNSVHFYRSGCSEFLRKVGKI